MALQRPRLRHPQVSDGAGATDEAGTASLFVVVAVVALMLAIGLVVDGGQKVQAIQRANALAAEAARAGSQMIVAAPSVRGAAPRLDPSAAEGAAARYLQQRGQAADGSTVDGTSSADTEHVTVEVTVTRPTIFLSAIGIGSVSATSHADARLVRGLDQELP